MLTFLFTLFLLVLGIAGFYWTGKRAFHRRNMAGQEEFSSYEKAVSVQFLEKAIRLISLLLIVVGGLSTIAQLFFGIKH